MLSKFTSLISAPLKKTPSQTSMVVQWTRIRLPTQDTGVRSLIWEDLTGQGAAKPVPHDCRVRALQLVQCPSTQSRCSTTRSHCDKKPKHRNKEQPHSPRRETLKSARSNRDPAQPKLKKITHIYKIPVFPDFFCPLFSNFLCLVLTTFTIKAFRELNWLAIHNYMKYFTITFLNDP